MKCSRCRGVMYCSKGCQVAHWKEHRKLCKSISCGKTGRLPRCKELKKTEEELAAQRILNEAHRAIAPRDVAAASPRSAPHAASPRSPERDRHVAPPIGTHADVLEIPTQKSAIPETENVYVRGGDSLCPKITISMSPKPIACWPCHYMLADLFWCIMFFCFEKHNSANT